jgi:excisionase family DNA binding protein
MRAILGENAPGGWGYQWLCITAPNFAPTATSLVQAVEAYRPRPHKPRADVPKPPEGYMTTYRAAKMIDVNFNTVFNWAKRGHIPYKKIGRNYFVRFDDVAEYNERRSA